MNGQIEETRPTAFVSYAQTSEEWQHQVLRFTTALRTRGGIDAELDLFHGADHQQWTTFGSRLVAGSDFTLIAVDSAYRRRWLGEEEKGVGAGAAREAAAVRALFEKDQDDFVRRIKVVLLPGAEVFDIPDDLLGVCERFEIEAFDEVGLDALLRSLWGRPAYPKPPLGEIPTLPPKAVESLERDSSATDPEAPDEQRVPSSLGHDAGDEASLRKQLDRVQEALSSPGGAAKAEELARERTAIEVSLKALSEAQKEQRIEAPASDELPEPLQPLVAALSDQDESVRFQAMSALRNHLRPELLPVIEPLLKDADSYIRQMAVEYYAELAGSDATGQLVAALSDQDESVRFQAMSALRNHLRPELLPVIEPLLKDADSYIRQMAVEYYAELAA
jgi:hypothetical protein